MTYKLSAATNRAWIIRCSWLTFASVVISACTSTPAVTPSPRRFPDTTVNRLSNLKAQEAGREILMYALGLLNLNYRFGGKNPEAGLDCSGMVSYIYRHAVGVTLPHNAQQIARLTRPIPAERLQVGDLVFFNTLNRAFSHMGIYIGEGKFVHAPRSRSTIRIDRLDNRYFASRFEGGRTLFQ